MTNLAVSEDDIKSTTPGRSLIRITLNGSPGAGKILAVNAQDLSGKLEAKGLGKSYAGTFLISSATHTSSYGEAKQVADAMRRAGWTKCQYEHVESVSGAEVHSPQSAHSAVNSVGARAFTKQSGPAFGGKDSGNGLIGHELTHTLQQRPNATKKL